MFNTLAVTVPAMRAAGNGGAIIVTASGAGLRSAQNLADYNASKHAVVGLAQTLANEVAKDAIRVNVIAPGTVNTPMVTANTMQFKVFRPDLPDPQLDDCMDTFKMIMPMGHPWVDPTDISNVVVFLASDEARYITGHRHARRPRGHQQSLLTAAYFAAIVRSSAAGVLSTVAGDLAVACSTSVRSALPSQRTHHCGLLFGRGGLQQPSAGPQLFESKVLPRIEVTHVGLMSGSTPNN